MNSYGIKFPKSREEYDAMVRVLQQTIYDTARASLYVNQMVTAVKVIEIEGITPQRSTRRELQSDEETGSFECTFQQRRSCCARDPPLGAGNPAQYCESLGCNLNNCRRIRFDIVAEQLLEQGMNRNLQSIFEVSTQRAVNDLYNTITLYMTEQVENEEFTISLRKNAYYCGDVCLNTMADATVMNVEFLPPTDILIGFPTPAPKPADPTPRPTLKPIRTFEPRTREPTLYPTLSPTQISTGSPTLFPTQLPTITTEDPTLFPTQYPTRYPVSCSMSVVYLTCAFLHSLSSFFADFGTNENANTGCEYIVFFSSKNEFC
jgi:hypothetical protein